MSPRTAFATCACDSRPGHGVSFADAARTAVRPSAGSACTERRCDREGSAGSGRGMRLRAVATFGIRAGGGRCGRSGGFAGAVCTAAPTTDRPSAGSACMERRRDREDLALAGRGMQPRAATVFGIRAGGWSGLSAGAVCAAVPVVLRRSAGSARTERRCDRERLAGAGSGMRPRVVVAVPLAVFGCMRRLPEGLVGSLSWGVA